MLVLDENGLSPFIYGNMPEPARINFNQRSMGNIIQNLDHVHPRQEPIILEQAFQMKQNLHGLQPTRRSKLALTFSRVS